MSEITETFDTSMAGAAQEEYCDRTGAPHFAPGFRNGYRCYRCGQNIYGGPRTHLVTGRTSQGYSVEYARDHLITGCPFCHYSFCE